MIIPNNNRRKDTPNPEARTILTACITSKLQRLNMEELRNVYAAIAGILDKRTKPPMEAD